MRKPRLVITDPLKTPKHPEDLDLSLKLNPILCKMAFLRHAALSMNWEEIPDRRTCADVSAGMSFFMNEIINEIKAIA